MRDVSPWAEPRGPVRRSCLPVLTTIRLGCSCPIQCSVSSSQLATVVACVLSLNKGHPEDGRNPPNACLGYRQASNSDTTNLKITNPKKPMPKLIMSRQQGHGLAFGAGQGVRLGMDSGLSRI